MSKRNWFLLLTVLFIGILLRTVFLFSTDLTWDEAFHILLAFKLGLLFTAFPIVLIGLLATTILFTYFVLFKQSLTATALFCLIPIAMVFVLGLPITIHQAHPPFFNIFEGVLIALTSLDPELLGKLISFSSSIALAFAGFFLARHLSGIKAGLIVFALLLFSPFQLLYSTTTYNVMLADSLAFIALTLFIIGMDKNNKLIPLSGFFFALAFFTRYTTLMFLLPVIVLFALNRKSILTKENISKYAIFGMLVASTIISLLPAIINGLNLFLMWGQINTSGLFIKDLPHYSAFLVNAFGEHPITSNLFFYVKETVAFYSMFLPIIFFFAIVTMLKTRKRIPLAFALLFFAYLVFYSVNYGNAQDMNFFLEIEIPMLFLTGLFLGELKSGTLQKIVVGLLLVLFLSQSIFMVSEHDYKGLSETVSKIPLNKTVMTTFIDPVKYYSGEYVFDDKINNGAFLFLEEAFGEPKEKEHLERVVPYTKYLNGSEIMEDYVILTDPSPISEPIGFVKCFDSNHKEFTVFTAYAKTKELCKELQEKR